MRQVALVLALIALTVVPGRATDYLTLDGAWWSTASYADKTSVITGIIAGIPDGYFSATVGALRYIPLAKWKQASANLAKTAPRYTKSFGAYVSEVDAVYADPKADGIHLERVMLCLSDSTNADSCIQANEKALQP